MTRTTFDGFALFAAIGRTPRPSPPQLHSSIRPPRSSFSLRSSTRI